MTNIGGRSRSVRKMIDFGFGSRTIAKAAGLKEAEVRRLMAGKRKSRAKKKPSRAYKPETEFTPAELEIRAAIERERHFDHVKNKTQRKSK